VVLISTVAVTSQQRAQKKNRCNLENPAAGTTVATKKDFNRGE
jgi:hypothetical protein